jgi:hypothetical protein
MSVHEVGASGLAYHRWTILGAVTAPSGQGRRVMCRCECGTERVVRHCDLVSGASKSCGCWNKETQIKHGDARRGRCAPEYLIWVSMKSRCADPSDPHSRAHAGRGIRVCSRWQESYRDFLADMGRRPSSRHSLDRIDNDGNYEPGNCRWAMPATQTRNTRRARLLTVNGVTLPLAEWAERGGITLNTLNGRIKRGWTAEEAVFGQLKLFTPGRWGWHARLFR